MNTVSVLGLGYIGLPTAIVAAENGWSVVGFDIDERRVAAINAYDSVIKEPETAERLQCVLIRGAFRASVTLSKAAYYIIAVPTPCNTDKSPDLQAVWHTAQLLSAVIQPGACIILESTVPVGTTEKFAEKIQNLTGLRAGIDFYCAHCPERVLPGSIFKELIDNARIIGGINKASIERAKAFYATFVQGALYLTQSRTAELVKLIENSYRDVQVAFAHQVAQLAEATSTDPYELIELANQHPRVSILRPKGGVGGHCIAVDPWFLIHSFPKQTALLQTARLINDQRPITIIQEIRTLLTNNPTHKMLLLGATYKPNIDDLRESPALFIAQTLMREFPESIQVCEPHVHDAALISYGLIPTTLNNGLAWADSIVALVDHQFFKNECHRIEMHQVIDFCGLLYKEKLLENCTEYNMWQDSCNIFENAL
jgi:UDP-N-acetyl-D-mannosaminuronic acid dehydrogenase